MHFKINLFLILHKMLIYSLIKNSFHFEWKEDEKKKQKSLYSIRTFPEYSPNNRPQNQLRHIQTYEIPLHP